MSEIRKKILERAKNFDAVLSVKGRPLPPPPPPRPIPPSLAVIAAQGLNLKSISGIFYTCNIQCFLSCHVLDRRIIVTVAVGNQKKSTKASKESNPVWNETFDLYVSNMCVHTRTRTRTHTHTVTVQITTTQSKCECGKCAGSKVCWILLVFPIKERKRHCCCKAGPAVDKGR